ncbi:kielin/chordin-like protein [Oratosquilla oratoria]|uniref:kielin/chordin-like protein n=1 Tax=Oratosquilla oratoria TaxID=337810 RepID=UPI003F776011
MSPPCPPFSGQCVPEPTKVCCNPAGFQGEFRDRCNWCRCDKGLGACTRINCDGLPREDYENQNECRGEVSWRKGHLICNCNNGQAVCRSENLSAQCSPLPSQECCNPTGFLGQFRKRCNWCLCDKGLGACTRINCDALPRSDYEGDSECRGQVSWRNGFLLCNCINGKAVCQSENLGVPCFLAPFQECCTFANTLGEFRQRCNWCRCDKGLGACTRINCDGLLPEDYENQEECRGRVTWRKGHLECNCVSGYGVCKSGIVGEEQKQF